MYVVIVTNVDRKSCKVLNLVTGRQDLKIFLPEIAYFFNCFIHKVLVWF